MGADFSRVKPLILAIEGGENTNKDDLGGLTKYGISQNAFPQVDIASLTFDQACGLLKVNYWDFYHLDDLSEQTIANQLFFLFINMDPAHAATIVQKAINACGRGIIVVKVDGVMGAATLKALNSIAPLWLGDRIRLEECRYYLAEADRSAKQAENFRGWIRRALTT